MLRAIAAWISDIAQGLEYRIQPRYSDWKLAAMCFKWVDIPLAEFQGAGVDGEALEILKELARIRV